MIKELSSRVGMLFEPPAAGLSSRLFTICSLAILFLLGCFHWLVFLNYGQLRFTAYDWREEFLYYSVLRDALTQHNVPYHISLALSGTERFLGNPQILLSPQVLLLPLLGCGRFVLVNTLLLYAIGFAGCLLLKRRYHLSVFSFAVLFVLFNFNGSITSHLAVGHAIWTGYFLLPFFCLLLLQWQEQERPRLSTSLLLSLVLFGVMLQGAFHLYVWCLLFLFFLALSGARYRKPFLVTLVSSGLLCACRIVPAAIAHWDRQPAFISGYPTLRDLFDGFTAIREDTYPVLGGYLGPLGWWEYDIYIGLVALAFLGCCGVYLFFKKDERLDGCHYRDLLPPVAALSILSLSYFYAPITMLPLPLLGAERVSSRFLILPVVILMVVACIRTERLLPWLKGRSGWQWLALAGLAETVFSLATHSYAWKIDTLERHFAFVRDPKFVVLIRQVMSGATIVVQMPADSLYILGVRLSALISLIALVAVVAAIAVSSTQRRRAHRGNAEEARMG